MSDIPPDDREEWIRYTRERLEREEGEKNRAKDGFGPNGQDADHAEEALRQLRIDIGQLNSDSTPEAVAAIAARIAASAADEISRERLLTTVKKQTKISIGTLRKQLAGSRKDRNREAEADRIQIKGLITEYPGGPPLALESNVITLIRAHPEMAGLFALDEFYQCSMLMRSPPWGRPGEKYPRPVRDADLGELLSWVQRQGVHLHGKAPIRTALASVIGDHKFHPVRDYLDGLVWDLKPRLDTWLTYYLGVAPIENYTGPVGRCWMISAVARIYQPGCLAKYVMVIEGKQDLGKSSAFRVLGGDWFTDDIAQLGSKDSQLQVGNAWIVELAELDSTRRADITATKAFISRQVDRFRPPYGEHVVTQPRQSVLGGTVNPAGAYLHDETGSVRFWPVAAVKIDLEVLTRDRDQLWAEAVREYKAGTKWWPDDDFTPCDEQAARSELTEHDPWFEIVAEWLRVHPQTHFTAHEVLKGAIKMSEERMDKAAERRLGAILRKLEWSSRIIRNGHDVCRRWTKLPADVAR